MPSPAADRAHRHTPKALAWLAGLACIGCCLLPVLIAAGLLGSTATAAKGLPALAVVLATAAAASWWWPRRRAARCTCSAGGTSAASCTCTNSQTTDKDQEPLSLSSRP
jgi:mercuric ion transport protein